MKKLRYFHAASGSTKKPSKRTLLRRCQQANQEVAQLSCGLHAANRRIHQIEDRAINAEKQLRNLLSTSVRQEFGQSGKVIDLAIRIDAGVLYRDIGSLFQHSIVELLHKILDQAPQLVVGPQTDFLKKVKELPSKRREESIYRLWLALKQDLSRSHLNTPESAELAELFRHGLHPYTFTTLLTLAAEHAHILEKHPDQDAIRSRDG